MFDEFGAECGEFSQDGPSPFALASKVGVASEPPDVIVDSVGVATYPVGVACGVLVLRLSRSSNEGKESEFSAGGHWPESPAPSGMTTGGTMGGGDCVLSGEEMQPLGPATPTSLVPADLALQVSSSVLLSLAVLDAAVT